MDEEELKDEICEYVHNLHKAEPFNGFSYRDLRDVAEHFALPREKRIAELEFKIKKITQNLEPQEITALFEQVEEEFEQEQRTKTLEKKISILLSCTNCPDNKGGLLCQKEYEDKCLAQKIQYIKELQEENAELEAKYLQATDEGTSFAHLKSLKQEIVELKYFIRDLIHENQNLCFQFNNTTCLFNSDYRNRAEELIGEKL